MKANQRIIDFPIQVRLQVKNNKMILLKGKINTANSYLIVTLTEPFLGQKPIHYGWASGVSKHYILDDDGFYTQNAIRTSMGVLVEIYEKAQPENIACEKERKIEELKRQIREIENS